MGSRKPLPLASLPLPLRSLQRLEALRIGGVVTAVWLPRLLEGDAAAALSRLVDLHVGFSHTRPADLPPAPWRAPWLPQLTRLAVGGGRQALQHIARALPPRALRALRALEVLPTWRQDASADDVRGLLAACDATALQALTLRSDAASAAVAAGLPSLRSLRASDLGGFGAGEAEATLHALAAAPLAPLTRLEIRASGCGGGGGLEALLAAPWAASLRELSIRGLPAPIGTGPVGRFLFAHALRGLSALTALRRLELVGHAPAPEALEEAAREGWADGWAPRLTELRLRTGGNGWAHPYFMPPGAPAALLRLPLRRLRRLELELFGRSAWDWELNKSTGQWEARGVAPDEVEAFCAACASALPALTALDVFARYW